jgi:hypothetical protein
MLKFDNLERFAVGVQDLAKQCGIEIKMQGDILFWPTYDTRGGLDQWFCLYIKTQETTQNE